MIPSFNIDLTPEIQQEINPEGSQTTGKWKFTYSISFSPENLECKGQFPLVKIISKICDKNCWKCWKFLPLFTISNCPTFPL